MNYKLVELLSYSVGIGAIIGLVRINKIDRAYYPFIILLWLGIVNEIVNTAVINAGYSNAINDNIYSLLESLLVLWLFKNWGLFRKNKKIFLFFLLLFVGGWVAVNFFISSITQFSSYYNILYGFSIVLMSIHRINQLIVNEKTGLLKNAIFLISIGFVAFFMYKVLVEIFWVYGLNASREFRLNVYRILMYVNLTVNLLYALAALWIPAKRTYTWL